MQKSPSSIGRILTWFYFIGVSGLAIGQTTYPVNSNVDILHYTFSLELSDDTNVIQGEAVIAFTLKDQNIIFLDLDGLNGEGKGMVVDQVSSHGKKLAFEHKQNRLKVMLGNEKKQYEIKVIYHGEAAAGLIIDNNKFGEKVFFGDNYPDRARNWIPCVDHPSDKAMVTWVITTPDHYKVVASGKLVSEKAEAKGSITTTWDEKVPISTKVMTFGAANFAVDISGEVNGVPISTWVFKQNQQEGFHDFAIAPKVVAYFDSLIGPYPYEKLANVQSKTTYGGMENASNIFYFEESVNGKAERESMIAHEIVHQWFGNSATEKDWPHAWLSEGFATYLTHVYHQSRYGQDRMDEGLAANRKKVLRYWHQNPLPIVNYHLVTYPRVENFRVLLNTNTYQKASWVLHMLRNELGDEVFFKVVRTYYRTYRDSNASTEDFQKVAEEVSGKDLKLFFNQWLYGKGQPVLAGNWSVEGGEISIGVNQLQDDPFIFPLEIGLVYGDEIIIKKVEINSAEEQFNVSEEAPDKIIFDPNTRLLFEGDAILKKK